MLDYRIVRGTAVYLAAVGMMLPHARLLADAPQPKAPIVKTGKVSRIPDLVLTEGGTMTGRVCDHSGRVLEGANVTLKQSNKVIATTVTDKEGLYSFKNLKGGIYHAISGNTEGIFRVWTEKTAPPNAKQHALLVMGENGTRGQFGAADPTLIILTVGVIAAVALMAVELQAIDKNNTNINNLQTQINTLTRELNKVVSP